MRGAPKIVLLLMVKLSDLRCVAVIQLNGSDLVGFLPLYS